MSEPAKNYVIRWQNTNLPEKNGVLMTIYDDFDDAELEAKTFAQLYLENNYTVCEIKGSKK